jgi:hypothetical protein
MYMNIILAVSFVKVKMSVHTMKVRGQMRYSFTHF